MSSLSFSHWIEQRLNEYFHTLEGAGTADVYNMILKEVDSGILRATLQYTKGNQSLAASILGMSRVTLKKKITMCDIKTCAEEETW